MRRGIAAIVRSPISIPVAFARWLWAVTAGTATRSARDDVTGIASQFAYNAFLATVPFLFVVLAAAGLFGSPEEYARLVERNRDAIPNELQGLITSILETASDNAQQAALFLVVGIAGALYVSANMMGALIGGIDRVRGVRHRPWLLGKLVALGFAGLASLMVLVTSIALVGGPRLINWCIEGLGLGDVVPHVGTRIVYPVGGAALLIFTLALYRYGPNAPTRRLRDEIVGAIFAVGIGVGAIRGFAAYVDGFDSYNRVYGSLGAVVIYMISLFLAGTITLVGAEVNEQLAVMRERRRMLRAQRSRVDEPDPTFELDDAEEEPTLERREPRRRTEDP
jgi:membrane protein